MGRKLPVLFSLLLLLSESAGATYYVDAATGNNADDGLSLVNAWLTIQKAEDTMTAGDTVYVSDGTYNERVAVTVSGTPASPIKYVGNITGSNVIMRGFDLNAVSNVWIIGFEITHTNITWSRGIGLDNVNRHLKILNNYFHHINGDGGCIRAVGPGDEGHFVEVRGNRFFYLGFVLNGTNIIFNDGNAMCVQLEEVNTHWLVEYNIMQRAGDFIDINGPNHVIRNNWVHDYDDAYFAPGAGHVDTYQPFQITNQIYEANLTGDNAAANSHHMQIRDPGTNIIWRGDVGYNYGSYVGQISAVDHARIYNNTWYDFCNISSGTPLGFDDEGVDGAIDGLAINNIFHTVDAVALISVVAAASAIITNNSSYLAPTTGGGVVETGDPLFVDIGAKQFWLQSGSPVRGKGRHITTVTSASSSGTSLDFANAKDFTDGRGVIEGDLITVSGNAMTRIVSISGNTVTVAASQTWTNGAPVYWQNRTANDLGAYPYGHVPLSAATYAVNGATVTVTPTGDTRGVWFWENGAPVTWDYDAPYTHTQTGGTTLTVYVGALHASATPIVLAAATGGGEGAGTSYRNKGRASRSAGVIP